MSRSLKKGPFIEPRLLKKISQLKAGKIKEPIKTWSRASTIFPEMVGISFAVHNGRKHIAIKISEDMVGHKLGEFVPTRTFHKHGGRMAKEQAMETQSSLAKEETKDE